MTEIELTETDKKRIKDDIKITLILGLLFSIALIVVVLIIPLIFYFFGKTANGFLRRSLFIIGGLSLPFLAVSWKNIFKYIDLRIGRKTTIKTEDYKIEKTIDGFVLKTQSPLKLKLDLWGEIPALIKVTEPLTIEITKLSKTLLFISQDTVNLLVKIEDETEKEIQNEFNRG
ncbi:hypothetical protein WBG78_14505 [Chryseolinea sp. T2]|uniref:hypothetical protein n=1 Tax=Chryseolinea sp. T2 TaxID=3129255 RepID=UPI0030781555